MASNNSLLQKADLAIADIQAGGGELLPQEGATFVRKLIAQPTLLAQARVIEMNGPRRNINKVGFGSRILRKATSATALTQSQRSKPLFEQVQLNTKEQIAEVRIPYDAMEDNIERATAANNEASNTGPGGLRQTIIDLIGERAALDMEELGILADTDYENANSQDDEDFLSQTDGFIKQGLEDGNVADMSDAPIARSMFKSALKTMPVQYLRNRASLVHFVSTDNETEYRDTLADRATGLGDGMVTRNDPVYAFGSPIQSVALMPEDKGVFTNPLNFIFGIQRQVSLEFDKDITARVYIIVLTARIDFKIEEPESMVVYENIGQAA